MTAFALVHAADPYTEQAGVTNWPARVVLVLVILGLIALALRGMRRGWQNRKARQSDVPAPADAPPDVAVFSAPVEGLYAGTGVNGDWMDRIVVYDLGVRSRGQLSYGPAGVWIERIGARSVFIPADAIAGIRADRGVAGTVRGKDSMAVVTWHLGDRVLDTAFRADSSADHGTVLDGLMAEFTTEVQ